MNPQLFVGLMSGTSIDGIDAVLVDFAASAPRIISALTHPWPEPLQRQLHAVALGAAISADRFAQLDADVGDAFAAAAQAVIRSELRDHIIAIGSHGQTLAHAPPAYTLQIGSAARIAEATGITTVADFRSRDIAAGGQGAPLAPAFHHAMFAEDDFPRCVLNLGGIANLSYLPDADAGHALGFDTGPASCLMDNWIRQQLGQPLDRDGAYARTGRVDPALLKDLLADDYFSAVPPKSTGTDYFSPAWLQSRLHKHTTSPQDVQATLLALTVTSVAQAVRRYAADCRELLVCGGGVHNTHLMDTLGEQLEIPVLSTANKGLDPDWIEGMAFAWLAQRTLAGLPGNLPGVTGATGPRILGAVYPA